MSSAICFNLDQSKIVLFGFYAPSFYVSAVQVF